MNTLRFLVVLLAGGIAGNALACEYPPLVTVPDGAEATMEEMLVAQTAVKDYIAAMDGYLACINDELTAAGDDAPATFKSIMVNRHNAAHAEMEAVATAFNEQRTAFLEANPGDR